MQETIEEIQQNLEKITTTKNKDNPLLDRTDKLSDLSDKVAKLEQTLNKNDLKIKDTNEKFADDIFELNNKITQNIFNPLFIVSNGSSILWASNISSKSDSSSFSYATVFNERYEFSGICFCLFDVFIAVINCLSIHKLANVLNEFCFSGL